MAKSHTGQSEAIYMYMAHSNHEYYNVSLQNIPHYLECIF